MSYSLSNFLNDELNHNIEPYLYCGHNCCYGPQFWCTTNTNVKLLIHVSISWNLVPPSLFLCGY